MEKNLPLLKQINTNIISLQFNSTLQIYNYPINRVPQIKIYLYTKNMSRPRKASLQSFEKLQRVIDGGNFYGAQQMYKSTRARYIVAERYSEALDILESGACLQLKQDQVTCGAELALLFIETLVKGKFPYNDDLLDRLRKIYEAFLQNAVPDHVGDDDDMQKLSEVLGAAKIRVEACASFLRAAIRWSIELGPDKNGSWDLHTMLAEYIYSETPEVDMAKVSFQVVRGTQINLLIHS